MNNKLTPAQESVLKEMEKGKILALRHGIRNMKWRLDGMNQNKSTIEGLRKKGMIEFDYMEPGGITYHYYKLTAKGKSAIFVL